MHYKKIRRYKDPVSSLYKEEFEPIVLEVNELGIQTKVDLCNRTVLILRQLKITIGKFLSKDEISDEELLKLFSFSEEKLVKELQRQYIIANNIKIEGLNVKIDKLADLINIPDFSHILEEFEKVRQNETKLDNITGLRLSLKTFFAEGGIGVTDEVGYRIMDYYTVTTKSMGENRAYLAALKILEGFAELEDIGVRCTDSQGFPFFAGDLIKFMFTNNLTEIGVNHHMLSKLRRGYGANI